MNKLKIMLTTLLASAVIPLQAQAIETAGDAARQPNIGMSEWHAGVLPVTLVYPTASAERSVTIGPFSIRVAPDAPPLPGHRPLIVISHGTGGSAVADHALAAALARAGFVVAQPLHQGDNYLDARDAGPVAFERRPSEVSAVIDDLARDPRWRQHLDLRKVGVHGMSAGGVTALSMAGAQWNLLTMVRHCNRHREADAGFCFQGAVTAEARADRVQRYERARWVPDWFMPASTKTLHGGRSVQSGEDPRPDPRIESVSLAVPVAAIFTAESLARIRIPVFVVAAQDDQVLVPRFHAQRVLAYCRTASMMSPLAGAGHFDLLSPWPQGVAQQVAATQPRGGLPNPSFDRTQLSAAHARIVAFHLQQLGTPPSFTAASNTPRHDI